MSTMNGVADEIVDIEWEMFLAVNDGLDPATCQEEKGTFEAMRKAQYVAWPEDVLSFLLEDYKKAREEGRNLLAEKYIHMMQSADPEQYAVAIESIPAPSEEQRRLAGAISEQLLAETQALHEEFPYLAMTSRPLRASQDTPYVTSVETYQIGEMLTYSEKTLRALYDYVMANAKAGNSTARRILENTVRYYGFINLIEANAAIRERVELQNIRYSPESDCDGCDFDGCGGCDGCDGCE